ncbi:unnamed protein product, partial [marine sediment metagenome]
GTIVRSYGSLYKITTNQALMEVIELKGSYIRVRIIFHKERDQQHEVGTTHTVEKKHFKKVSGAKKLNDLVNSKRKKIISEIKKNSSMKKCFSNVNKEVNEWSIAQILGWFDECTKSLSRLF